MRSAISKPTSMIIDQVHVHRPCLLQTQKRFAGHGSSPPDDLQFGPRTVQATTSTVQVVDGAAQLRELEATQISRPHIGGDPAPIVVLEQLVQAFVCETTTMIAL